MVFIVVLVDPFWMMLQSTGHVLLQSRCNSSFACGVYFYSCSLECFQQGATHAARDEGCNAVQFPRQGLPSLRPVRERQDRVLAHIDFRNLTLPDRCHQQVSSVTRVRSHLFTVIGWNYYACH